MCAPSPPPAPDYAGAATAQGTASKDAATATAMLSNPNVNSPTGSQTVSYSQGPDGNWIPTINQSLSPEQQRIFDTNQAGQQSLADLGVASVNKASGILGQSIDFSGAPSVKQFDPSSLPQQGQVFDPNSLSPIGDSSATRAKVMAAMMGRANEDYTKRTDQSNSDLIARGIPVGSKAYADQQQMIERARTDANQQAELTASDVANQMFNQDLNLRNQQMGAQGQQYSQAAGNRTQALNEGATTQNLSTAARQQVIQELLAQRSVPINEISALRSGSQVTPLQFQGYQGANVQAAPIMGATQQQGAYDMNAYNQQVGSSNATTGAVTSAAAMAAMYF